MVMEHLLGFGYRNRASLRIRIWEWWIFQDSDMGMKPLSRFGYENGGSFRFRIW